MFSYFNGYNRILGLQDNPAEDLSKVHVIYAYTFPGSDTKTFVSLVNHVLDLRGTDGVMSCVVCQTLEWGENCIADVDGDLACASCRDNYSSCGRCSEWSISDDFLYWVDENAYCDSCRSMVASWCDDCDDYYHNDNAEFHYHGSCDCSPHDLHFQVLANSHGVMHQDERLFVELPKGTIPEEAIDEVVRTLWREQFSQIWRAMRDNGQYDESMVYSDQKLRETIWSLEHVWQTKTGNFTKRLSKALYQNHNNFKLDPGLLSLIGARVRAHTDETSGWHIEFTRDLNQSAEAFYHDDSCWWGSYGQSRCALKHWGGFGMRSYETEDTSSFYPSGRAWVQPLNSDLQPTSDTVGAPAYVVYNGYGELEGYTPARLLAYLTSRTYKKIDFSATDQYVNSESGYLIADQEACSNTTGISVRHLSAHQKVAA